MDSTIIGLLCALNLYDRNPLHSPSILILELYKDAVTGDSYIEIYMKNGTLDGRMLNIPDCPYPCYLHTLINITSDVIPGSFDEMCYLDSWLNDPFSHTPALVGIIIVICIATIASVTGIGYICRKTKCCRKFSDDVTLKFLQLCDNINVKQASL